LNWIINNKEWLFSGIAIAIPIAIFGWAFSTRANKQVQKGGDNSTNIQVGRNATLKTRKSDE